MRFLHFVGNPADCHRGRGPPAAGHACVLAAAVFERQRKHCHRPRKDPTTRPMNPGRVRAGMCW